MRMPRYGPENPDATYVAHGYAEQLFDAGEVSLNYVCAGSADKPALLLIPAQTESWWGYEPAIERLAQQFQVFAVDLRGQGRSSRTPGRYTLDNMGNDLVRLIAFLIRRPVVVSGLSSDGLLAAWLSAYAPPGMLRGAFYEDPPRFASELATTCGPGIRQSVPAAAFRLWSTYLGDQWCVGDWEGLLAALGRAGADAPPEPPQNLKEYDPEWARAFVSGTVAASCDHARMLRQVRCPVLLTHHAWSVDEATGRLSGAMSGQQAARVRELVTAAGQPVEFHAFPAMHHYMHRVDPERYTALLTAWAAQLPSEDMVRRQGVFTPI